MCALVIMDSSLGMLVAIVFIDLVMTFIALTRGWGTWYVARMDGASSLCVLGRSILYVCGHLFTPVSKLFQCSKLPQCSKLGGGMEVVGRWYGSCRGGMDVIGKLKVMGRFEIVEEWYGGWLGGGM